MRRVLLLQVRDEPRAEAQERLCFLEATRLAPEQMRCRNLVAEPDLRWRHLRGIDAVLVGGAGAHTVTRTYPFTGALNEVLLRLVTEGRPLFGSCYGHHALVEAMGGSVVTDHGSGEVGTFDVELTEAGRADPLFAGLPSRFACQLGHHDRVDRLPPGLVELAFSDRCRYQALRAADRPVYCTQFHSEMNQQHMRARLMMYRDGYLPASTTAAEMAHLLGPSPWVEGLLRRFLELFT